MTDINISKIMEDAGIEPEKIDEVVSFIKNMKEEKPSDNQFNLDHIHGQTTALKMAMDKEPDWRKRASLAARILSLELDV